MTRLLDEDGPNLVFSTSPAPEGIDTDAMFLESADRISVHISRKAINAQVLRRSLQDDGVEYDHEIERDEHGVSCCVEHAAEETQQ